MLQPFHKELAFRNGLEFFFQHPPKEMDLVTTSPPPTTIEGAGHFSKYLLSYFVQNT
jgi:hypothetical protein